MMLLLMLIWCHFRLNIARFFSHQKKRIFSKKKPDKWIRFEFYFILKRICRFFCLFVESHQPVGRKVPRIISLEILFVCLISLKSPNLWISRFFCEKKTFLYLHCFFWVQFFDVGDSAAGVLLSKNKSVRYLRLIIVKF